MALFVVSQWKLFVRSGYPLATAAAASPPPSFLMLQTVLSSEVSWLNLKFFLEPAVKAGRVMISDQGGDGLDRELGVPQEIGGFLQARVPEKALEVNAHLKPE